MNSHLFHMLTYSTLVSVFLAALVRRDSRSRIRFAGSLWLAMVGGALALAYLMYPFPN